MGIKFGYTSDPGHCSQAIEYDWCTSYAIKLELVHCPHILKFGHFGAIAPRGKRQQKMWQQQAYENHIVNDFVETL